MNTNVISYFFFFIVGVLIGKIGVDNKRNYSDKEVSKIDYFLGSIGILFLIWYLINGISYFFIEVNSNLLEAVKGTWSILIPISIISFIVGRIFIEDSGLSKGEIIATFFLYILFGYFNASAFLLGFANTI